MAIVDEADSVLIDEARLPLILARPDSRRLDANALGRVLGLARSLVPGRHFEHLAGEESIELTDAGRAAAAELGGDARPREARLRQALVALHVYQRDRHYVVKDGRCRSSMPTPGASPTSAPGRANCTASSNSEGCALGTENRTAAQITYQRFFPRYLHLCGVSGTLRECAGELAAVYGRDTVALPTHAPCDACSPSRGCSAVANRCGAPAPAAPLISPRRVARC